MCNQTKTGASNTGSKPKTFLIADGNQNALDVFNSSQKAKKPQTIYNFCSLSQYNHLGAVKSCAEWTENQTQHRAKLFEHSKSVCPKSLTDYAETHYAIKDGSKRKLPASPGKLFGGAK